MAFKIKLFDGAPDLESLQVAKMDSFAIERASYRPYSQARLCFSPKGLHLQLLSFETLSPPDSRLESVLRLTDTNGKCGNFYFSLFADGRYSAALNSEPDNAAAARLHLNHDFHPLSGEDLQGVFWGGTFHLPLAQYFSFSLHAGNTFSGNFYKLCDTKEQAHRCSFFPAEFSKPLDAAENMGEFILIDY